MRKYIIFVTALLSASAQAQQAQNAQPDRTIQPRTKVEAFTGATGVVVIKGYTNVGRVSLQGAVEVTAMNFKNPNSDRLTSGLTIEVESAGGRSSYQNTKRSFVDYDEIQGLIDGINYILKINKDSVALNDFEASYTTKGDVKVTAFNDNVGKINIAVRAGGNYGGAEAYLDTEQTLRLINNIQNGKKLLDAAK